jgi:thioredoxin reductase
MGGTADVVVVGAGPAGISAGLLLGRMLRRTVLLDGGPTRNHRSPQVANLVGRDQWTPAALRRAGHLELARYGQAAVRDARAVSIDGTLDQFRVQLSDHGQVLARRVVLATGLVDELPAIEGLARLWGNGVLHCAYCHGWEVRGAPLAVLAANPSDALVAMQLLRFSPAVTLCTNGAVALSGPMRCMLDEAGVAVRAERVACLVPDGDRLRQVRFADGPPLAAAALFVQPRSHQGSDLAGQLGCRLLEGDLVAVSSFQRTSVAGVYAVGDMARSPSAKVKAEQVAVAAAEGVTAGITLDQDLAVAGLPAAVVEEIRSTPRG